MEELGEEKSTAVQPEAWELVRAPDPLPESYGSEGAAEVEPLGSKTATLVYTREQLEEINSKTPSCKDLPGGLSSTQLYREQEQRERSSIEADTSAAAIFRMKDGFKLVPGYGPAPHVPHVPAQQQRPAGGGWKADEGTWRNDYKGPPPGVLPTPGSPLGGVVGPINSRLVDGGQVAGGPPDRPVPRPRIPATGDAAWRRGGPDDGSPRRGARAPGRDEGDRWGKHDDGWRGQGGVVPGAAGFAGRGAPLDAPPGFAVRGGPPGEGNAGFVVRGRGSGQREPAAPNWQGRGAVVPGRMDAGRGPPGLPKEAAPKPDRGRGDQNMDWRHRGKPPPEGPAPNQADGGNRRPMTPPPRKDGQEAEARRPEAAPEGRPQAAKGEERGGRPGAPPRDRGLPGDGPPAPAPALQGAPRGRGGPDWMHDPSNAAADQEARRREFEEERKRQGEERKKGGAPPTGPINPFAGEMLTDADMEAMREESGDKAKDGKDSVGSIDKLFADPVFLLHEGKKVDLPGIARGGADNPPEAGGPRFGRFFNAAPQPPATAAPPAAAAPAAEAAVTGDSGGSLPPNQQQVGDAAAGGQKRPPAFHKLFFDAQQQGRTGKPLPPMPGGAALADDVEGRFRERSPKRGPLDQLGVLSLSLPPPDKAQAPAGNDAGAKLLHMLRKGGTGAPGPAGRADRHMDNDLLQKLLQQGGARRPSPAPAAGNPAGFAGGHFLQQNAGGHNLQQMGGQNPQQMAGQNLQNAGGQNLQQMGGQNLQNAGGQNLQQMGVQNLQNAGGQNLPQLGGQNLQNAVGQFQQQPGGQNPQYSVQQYPGGQNPQPVGGQNAPHPFQMLGQMQGGGQRQMQGAGQGGQLGPEAHAPAPTPRPTIPSIGSAFAAQLGIATAQPGQMGPPLTGRPQQQQQQASQYPGDLRMLMGGMDVGDGRAPGGAVNPLGQFGGGGAGGGVGGAGGGAPGNPLAQYGNAGGGGGPMGGGGGLADSLLPHNAGGGLKGLPTGQMGMPFTGMQMNADTQQAMLRQREQQQVQAAQQQQRNDQLMRIIGMQQQQAHQQQQHNVQQAQQLQLMQQQAGLMHNEQYKERLAQHAQQQQQQQQQQAQQAAQMRMGGAMPNLQAQGAGGMAGAFPGVDMRPLQQAQQAQHAQQQQRNADLAAFRQQQQLQGAAYAQAPAANGEQNRLRVLQQQQQNLLLQQQMGGAQLGQQLPRQLPQNVNMAARPDPGLLQRIFNTPAQNAGAGLGSQQPEQRPMGPGLPMPPGDAFMRGYMGGQVQNPAAPGLPNLAPPPQQPHRIDDLDARMFPR